MCSSDLAQDWTDGSPVLEGERIFIVTPLDEREWNEKGITFYVKVGGMAVIPKHTAQDSAEVSYDALVSLLEDFGKHVVMDAGTWNKIEQMASRLPKVTDNDAEKTRLGIKAISNLIGKLFEISNRLDSLRKNITSSVVYLLASHIDHKTPPVA